MIWIFSVVAVLAISGAIGMHLAHFREAYTEMTGMMAGMTMGMLNGFVLGFALAAATNSMFWGNLVGIILGLGLGVYFGRPGGVMGVMDGGMGGVMGGSMGAMLAVMLAFPKEYLYWTASLLGAIYVAGMVGLVILIERSAPGHAALHRLAPFFTRAILLEMAEASQAAALADEPTGAVETDYGLSVSAPGRSGERENPAKQRKLVDYYALLDISHNASHDDVTEAYLEAIEGADEAHAARLERAWEVLTDPQRRRSYDRKLATSEIPPRPIDVPTPSVAAAAAPISPGRRSVPVTVQVPGKEVAAQPGRGTGGQATNGATKGSAGGSSGGKNSQNRRGDNAGGKGAARKQGQGSRQTAQKRQVGFAALPQQRRASPVSWVGGLALVVILFGLGWWVLSTGAAAGAGRGAGTVAGVQSGAGGESLAQLDSQAVVAPVGTDGKQTIDIVLDSATFQYKPSVVKVKQGIPVHFNLSVINGDPG